MSDLKPGDRVLIECVADEELSHNRWVVIPLRGKGAFKTSSGDKPSLIIELKDIKWRREEGGDE